MKLLASPASPYTRKVRIVLAEKKIECEMEQVDVQPVENPVNAHNPLGKIPALILDDGTPVYDSRVIVEFLDGKSPISRLIPEDLRDRIAVRSAIEAWCRKHIGAQLEITCIKDYGMIELWDDRCIQVEPNTGRPIGRTRGL